MSGCSNATERALELFRYSTWDNLPKLAKEYLFHIQKRLGCCGEVYVMAFAHYAQAVEGLPPRGDEYVIDRKGLKWFKIKQMLQ